MFHFDRLMIQRHEICLSYLSSIDFQTYISSSLIQLHSISSLLLLFLLLIFLFISITIIFCISMYEATRQRLCHSTRPAGFVIYFQVEKLNSCLLL